MGEILKKFGKININKTDFEFELNKGHSKESPNSIHIQSESSRLEMDDKEFINLSLTVLEAVKKIKKMKGL